MVKVVGTTTTPGRYLPKTLRYLPRYLRVSRIGRAVGGD